MAWLHPASVAHEHKQWTRHDAHLWVRPGAFRFRSPGVAHDVRKTVARDSLRNAAKAASLQANEREQSTDEYERAIAISAVRRNLGELKYELAKIKYGLPAAASFMPSSTVTTPTSRVCPAAIPTEGGGRRKATQRMGFVLPNLAATSLTHMDTRTIGPGDTMKCQRAFMVSDPT
jgi:hypothetical protein